MTIATGGVNSCVFKRTLDSERPAKYSGVFETLIRLVGALKPFVI